MDEQAKTIKHPYAFTWKGMRRVINRCEKLSETRSVDAEIVLFPSLANPVPTPMQAKFINVPSRGELCVHLPSGDGARELTEHYIHLADVKQMTLRWVEAPDVRDRKRVGRYWFSAIEISEAVGLSIQEVIDRARNEGWKVLSKMDPALV